MGKRGPKGPNRTSFKKGQSGNPAGRLPGVKTARTKDFRTAVTSLLDDCGPELLGWIQRVAEKQPQRAVDCLAALAEFSTPKLSRITHAGDENAPVLFGRAIDDIPNDPVHPTTKAD